MEIRRALLLFVIVLGMAAIVSAVARQPSSDDTPERAAPSAPAPRQTATAAPAGGAKTIELQADAERKTRELEQGRPATVIVHVDAPGQVEIPSLGLLQSAEPLTPARFDILATSPGTHPILVRRASPGGRRETAAILRVVPAP